MLFIADVLQGLVNVDTQVFLSINGMHNPYFDFFMSTYSGKWIWVPMYAAILYVLLRNMSWKTALLCTVGVALTITFADQVCATLIRPYVERLRPSNLENPLSELVHIVNGRRGGAYGFPSCHSANTFALAFYLMFLFRRRGLTLFMMGWALLTCYSRVYLGVHYPGDLLAGAVVGFVGAWLMYRLFAWVARYRHPEKLEHLYVPVWVGALTIAGMLVAAFFR